MVGFDINKTWRQHDHSLSSNSKQILRIFQDIWLNKDGNLKQLHGMGSTNSLNSWKAFFKPCNIVDEYIIWR